MYVLLHPIPDQPEMRADPRAVLVVLAKISINSEGFSNGHLLVRQYL